jgi:hypothetical protein
VQYYVEMKHQVSPKPVAEPKSEPAVNSPKPQGFIVGTSRLDIDRLGVVDEKGQYGNG